MLLHQLIDGGDPDKIVFHGPAPVTYRQLRQTVDRYRAYLHAAGVRPGDTVGLLVRNSPAFVYAYMAVVSLRAIIVPINYQLTAAEVAYIVNDAHMKNLITGQPLDLAAPLAALGHTGQPAQHLVADIDAYTPAAGSVPAPVDHQIAETDPCTIIYTSGTTGSPKGAILTHRSLASDAIAYSTAMPVYPDDNILCILPLYHCLAWTCIILCALLHKASATILDTLVPKDVIDAIKRYRVNVMYGVPSVYLLLLKTADAGDLAGMRLLMSGGASLPRQIAEDFQRKFTIAITEGYGLSEASPVVATNPQFRAKPLSIGVPIPGIDVAILDPDDRPLPAGQVGELAVRGPIVMQGYYNLPAETAHTLRGGWLHTGDLAYRDDDGYIFIVDRLKDMIIAHGENIYPREVEEAIYTFPGIGEAAVIGVADDLRGQTVRAYLAMKDGQALDKKALKAHLREKLAAYKIPRDFVVLDALPKNAAGKILKRRLREQEGL